MARHDHAIAEVCWALSFGAIRTAITYQQERDAERAAEGEYEDEAE